MVRSLTAILSGVVVTALLLLASLLPQGLRDHGPVENIHGIPYPAEDDHIIITEPLAHADIYLNESVLAKKLVLEIDFDPGNTTGLAVGVREDPFWLSYDGRVPAARTVVIPLTDKLQEPNRSIDLMFFAEAPRSPGEVGWELHSLSARVEYALPDWPQLRNYARSILYRERAL